MNAPAKIKVHPLAALFPLMPDDELQELVADVKANGLRFPIVLDPDGQLLDGRNRLAACALAKVEPQFTTYEGDAEALIWSLNDRRRHMTKGARAMVAAMAHPEPEKGGKNKPSRNHEGISDNPRTAQNLLSQARLVLRHAPDLSTQVRDGAMPLDHAYHIAKRNKEAEQSADAVMARLREQAPDLAQLAANGQMSVSEASAAAEQRQIERVTQAKAATANLARLFQLLHPPNGDATAWVQQMFGDFDLEYWPQDQKRPSARQWQQCEQALIAIVEKVRT